MKDKSDVIDIINDFVKEHIPNTYNDVISIYIDEDVDIQKEECVAFFIEDILGTGMENEMASGDVRIKDKRVNEAVCKILNIINNGTENKKSKDGHGDIRRNRTGNDSRKRSSGMEMRDSDGNVNKPEGSKRETKEGIRFRENNEGQGRQSLLADKKTETSLGMNEVRMQLVPIPQYPERPKWSDYGGDKAAFLKDFEKYKQEQRASDTKLASVARKAVDKVDGFIINEVDSQAPIEVFQKFIKENGGTLSKDSNPYQFYFLSKGAATYLGEEFKNTHMKEITDAIKSILNNTISPPLV